MQDMHATDSLTFNPEHVQDKARMGTNNETHCLNVRQTVWLRDIVYRMSQGNKGITRLKTQMSYVSRMCMTGAWDILFMALRQNNHHVVSCLSLRQVIWPWHCPSACLDQDKVWTDCIAKEHAWTNSNTEFELDPSRSSLWDRLSPLGHIVWARDTLSNFQTSCLILRQAVSSWDKLSEFETARLATVWVCLFSRQIVQALDWLYC